MTHPTVTAWLAGDMPDAVFADWLEENHVDMEKPVLDSGSGVKWWRPKALRYWENITEASRKWIWKHLVDTYPHLENVTQ